MPAEANQGLRRHKLLPQDVAARLPALYSTEHLPAEDKILAVKFFTPYSSWTWYAVECDPEEGLFFGYVQGLEAEWGYFSLAELAEATVMRDLPAVERDRCWRPIRFSELPG